MELLITVLEISRRGNPRACRTGNHVECLREMPFRMPRAREEKPFLPARKQRTITTDSCAFCSNMHTAVLFIVAIHPHNHDWACFCVQFNKIYHTKVWIDTFWKGSKAKPSFLLCFVSIVLELQFDPLSFKSGNESTLLKLLSTVAPGTNTVC